MRYLAAALCCSTMLMAQTTLRVGAMSAIPELLDPIRIPLEKDHGLKLTYVEKGGVDMFLDLEAGRVDMVVVASSFEELLEMVQAKGHPVKLPYEYPHCQIGQDWISVLVSPTVLDKDTGMDLFFTELTAEKVKQLFTGKIRNWKAVGGPDLPVVVVTCTSLQTTNAKFRDEALKGEAFAAGVEIKGTLSEILETIGKTKGAIGIGPLSVTSNSKIWSPLTSHPIPRPYTFIASERSSPEVKRQVATVVEVLLRRNRKLAGK